MFSGPLRTDTKELLEMNRRRRWIALAGVAVAIAGCVTPPSGGWTTEPPSTPKPAQLAVASGATGSAMPMAMPMASSGAGGSGAAAATAGAIEIEAFDLGFKPATVSVAAAGTYDVSFHNTGS